MALNPDAKGFSDDVVVFDDAPVGMELFTSLDSSYPVPLGI